MNNAETDVMIHTKTTLSPAQFEEVSNRLRAIDGVIKFEQNPHRPNLIMIVYQAGKISSLTILNKLTRLGFNAALVGI